MKKQILAGVLLATLMVGVGANDSYAEYNEYRGTVSENGGNMNSPFVITEVNLRDNYLKVIYNGGIEGEVKLRNVDLLTWKPGAAGGKDNEDYLDWVLPSIHYSTPSYAYVVYNKSHYLFGDKFAKGVEETIRGGEMYSPLSDSPNMKLYYSLYIGPNTQATSFYTGKINYERCAGSRAFNREEMTCKAEMKADGSGIQYQPYMIATGERVEVPEDYDVVPGTDNTGSNAGEVSGEESDKNESMSSSEIKTGLKNDSTLQYTAREDVVERMVVASATKRTEGEMVIATPVDVKGSGVNNDFGAAEVLGTSLESLGDVAAKNECGGGWKILIGGLGTVGAFILGWLIFLLAKRRKKEEE